MIPREQQMDDAMRAQVRAIVDERLRDVVGSIFTEWAYIREHAKREPEPQDIGNAIHRMLARAALSTPAASGELEALRAELAEQRAAASAMAKNTIIGAAYRRYGSLDAAPSGEYARAIEDAAKVADARAAGYEAGWAGARKQECEAVAAAIRELSR